MGIDLPLLWAVIILFAVMMYVVMDGFDLGIGLLFPFFESKDDRDVMMNTVAPVWDGNETWLVLGGAGLMAAFPLAYAVVLSAFYLPLILMLIGLIFRGVAFEFRFKASAEERGSGGTWRSSAARRWRPSARAWCWAPSSKGFPCTTAATPAGRSTGCRRSRCSPAWG